MDHIINEDLETQENREESNDAPDGENLGEMAYDTPDTEDVGENNVSIDQVSQSVEVISNVSQNELAGGQRSTHNNNDGRIHPQRCLVCKRLVPKALRILTPGVGTQVRMTPVVEFHLTCCKNWREAQVKRTREELAIAIMKHRCDDAELNAIAKDIDLKGDFYGKFHVVNGVITMIPQVNGGGGGSGANINIANSNDGNAEDVHVGSGDANNASDVGGEGDQPSN